MSKSKKLLVALPRTAPANPLAAYGLVYAIAARNGIDMGDSIGSADALSDRVMQEFERRRRNMNEDIKLLKKALRTLALWSPDTDSYGRPVPLDEPMITTAELEEGERFDALLDNLETTGEPN